ncbi:sterol desaturase family protein [Polynucleobacter sp. UK-Kesae-W10]|uniref:sterol desaturase family protein n=1 Tax=Polynucleobacter sp. UK-Kesae-W10 TaxID=1819738 RepID=UPI001C0E89E9|nr:sterol desaturase family protein [Polynucleobacter sp. UK-Kesae-W10]MBU3577818.1 sterol desaturase family protein [Polynucleobacter sp. UK-Kesae-W10]
MEQFLSNQQLIYFLPLIAVAILVESLVYRWRYQKSYPWVESATSLGVGVGHQITGIINRLLIQGVMASFIWQYRLFTIPNEWWTYPALFLGLEFCYYWYHRASHEVFLMWATHSTHHSPNEMTLSAAYRLGWLPFLSFTWVFFFPLVFIGFSPIAVFTMLSINLMYQFWLHTKLIPRLGFLEGIINTPSAHRVHHASNLQYLDKNYGGILMIFDRIFGTYIKEDPNTEIVYGLTHPNYSKNPVNVVFSVWKQLVKGVMQKPTLSEKLKFIFSPPQ